MKLVIHIMIIIHMIKYWSYVFQITMIYILMKESTTLTINTTTYLIMIILITFKRQLLMQTHLLMIKMMLVKIGGV